VKREGRDVKTDLYVWNTAKELSDSEKEKKRKRGRTYE